MSIRTLCFKAVLATLSITILYNCQKNSDESLALLDEPIIETRSTDSVQFLWDTLSWSRALTIFNDMKLNASNEYWLEFMENHGIIRWDLAMQSDSTDNDKYIASIPSVINDTFSGLFLVRVIADQIDYKFFPQTLFSESTDQIFAEHGESYGAMAILNGVMFNRVLISHPDCSIESHLTSDRFLSIMESITPRGWCLKEFRLWEPYVSGGDNTPYAGMFVKIGNKIYQESIGGGSYTYVRKGVNLTPEELAHNDEVRDWRTRQRTKQKATLHGHATSGGYTIYRFWVICDDEFGQDPWEHNWTTNYDGPPTGGDGSQTGIDWEYLNNRWYEEDNDCFGYFNKSGRSHLLDVEEKWKAVSCGDAAEYMIKSTIDRVMNEKCADQLATGGLPFPGNNIDLYEMISAIEDALNEHTYVSLGRKICEICETKTSVFLKALCHDDFLECSGAPDYEACIEGIICSKEIEDYLANNDVTFFCSSMSPQEKLNELKEGNCPGPEDQEYGEYLLSLLDDDWIIEDNSFQNCPHLQCIYNKMLTTNEAANCSLLAPIFDSNTFGVELKVTTGLSDYTDFDNQKNKATIRIQVDPCDGTGDSDLNLASTLAHELIHAEIMKTLFDMGLDPNNMQSFSQAWDNYRVNYLVNLKNDKNLRDIHHAVMVFVEGESGVSGGNAVHRIAQILWELNGKNLTVEHFYHLAWAGLRYIDSSQWGEDKFGINSSFYTLHLELLNSNPNLSIGC